MYVYLYLRLWLDICILIKVGTFEFYFKFCQLNYYCYCFPSISFELFSLLIFSVTVTDCPALHVCVVAETPKP